MDIKIEELINKALREKEAEREKKEQISWYISGLGGCLRGQYFGRLGMKPDYPIDDRTLRVFDKGNQEESWLVNLLKTQSDVIELEEQVHVEDKELNISGRVDIVLKFRDEKLVYEIKSKHSRSFWHMKNKGPQRSHQYQLWCYLWLLKIERGKLVYLSKDDSGIMEFEVRKDDRQIMIEVLMNINLLNRAWKAQDPSLLPLPLPDSWQAKYCSYHKQCLKVRGNKLTKK